MKSKMIKEEIEWGKLQFIILATIIGLYFFISILIVAIQAHLRISDTVSTVMIIPAYLFVVWSYLFPVIGMGWVAIKGVFSIFSCIFEELEE